MKFGKAVARSWSVASVSSARPINATAASFPLAFDNSARRDLDQIPDTKTGVKPSTKTSPDKERARRDIFADSTNNKLKFTSQPINQGVFVDEKLSQSDARDLLCKLREEALSSLVLEGLGTISVKKVMDSEDIERMGSFTSAPVKASGDTQDADVDFDGISCMSALLDRCKEETLSLPEPINRHFFSFQHTPDNDNKTDVTVDEKPRIRLLQWNHLSQTLGTKNDNFVVCPPEALDWTTRRWRLLQEIIRYQPDVICLQEVDHFDFLSRGLKAVGYSGKFVPKPDSPCIYLQGNNGPDGCAIFVKDSKFKILSESHRILEVWRVQSNQVALCLELEDLESQKEVVVATTHLKARQGALLSTLRNEQGADLLDWLQTTAKGRPILLSGDFNAPQTEPIYNSVCQHSLNLDTTYKFDQLTCEPYTTWKIRETGEQKYILDYIFHSKEGLTPVGVLEMPAESEVGEARFPNLAFPSDHLSLVADFNYA